MPHSFSAEMMTPTQMMFYRAILTAAQKSHTSFPTKPTWSRWATNSKLQIHSETNSNQSSPSGPSYPCIELIDALINGIIASSSFMLRRFINPMGHLSVQLCPSFTTRATPGGPLLILILATLHFQFNFPKHHRSYPTVPY